MDPSSSPTSIQIRTVPSRPALTTAPFGPGAVSTQQTTPSCPWTFCINSFVLTSQNRMSPSSLPELMNPWLPLKPKLPPSEYFLFTCPWYVFLQVPAT